MKAKQNHLPGILLLLFLVLLVSLAKYVPDAGSGGNRKVDACSGIARQDGQKWKSGSICLWRPIFPGDSFFPKP